MRGQIKMSRRATVAQTIGISTGVQFGTQGAPDQVTMRLSSHDAKNDDGGTIGQSVWMPAKDAVALAAALLLHAWEISRANVSDDAVRFVNLYFQQPGTEMTKKTVNALIVRDAFDAEQADA